MEVEQAGGSDDVAGDFYSVRVNESSGGDGYGWTVVVWTALVEQGGWCAEAGEGGGVGDLVAGVAGGVGWECGWFGDGGGNGPSGALLPEKVDALGEGECGPVGPGGAVFGKNVNAGAVQAVVVQPFKASNRT